MKKLLIVFIAIWVQSAYAQKKVDLFSENEYFGNLDSLFEKVDFNVFLKGTKQKHVIIPVGILIYEHQKMKPDAKLDVWVLKNQIPHMMADHDLDRYKTVFLDPYFVVVSTKIYN